MSRISLRGIHWRSGLRSFASASRKIGPRLYAAALICVICYLTFLAVRYLIVSLATSKPPAQVVEFPRRLERSVLGTQRAAWRGIEATENPRSPLAHYHRLDSWIAPDYFSGCTQSGCHAPLPHSKHKEVRAFLNMHATSIHCGVCHFQTEEKPLPLIWYDLDNGKARHSPRALEAYEIITAADTPPKDEKEAKATQKHLVHLLRSAAKDAGNSTSLNELADHLAAYRATSDEFAQLWKSARDVLPRHFRGEYGAKLALRDSAGQPILSHPKTEEAVRAFLERGGTVSKEDRAMLLAAVHPLKREKPRHCTDCHTAEGSLIDFARAGYPRARINSLTNPMLFRMIEHINSGQPMNLPGIMQPTTQPVSPR